jgi:hypothetical protein
MTIELTVDWAMWVIDSLLLAACHRLATTANCKQGQDVIIAHQAPPGNADVSPFSWRTRPVAACRAVPLVCSADQ